MKSSVCKGSTIVEMTYLMPLVLMVWVMVIFMLFFYHDKSVVVGAAYEASVVGSELWMQKDDYRSAKIENYFKERIDGKLLFFENIDVKVFVYDTKVLLRAAASKYIMSFEIEAQATITEPENVIRQMNIMDEIIEGATR